MIIGSTAIKHWYEDFPREPKDLDIATNGYSHSVPTHDGHVVEFLENPVLLDYYYGKPQWKSIFSVVEPDILLTLKASHLFWDINWDKHMWDAQFLIEKGHHINRELFFKLYDYWNTVHGKNRRSDLTMNKAEFFDNALKTYDHDHLHTLINPTPIYLSMLAENAEVEVDENKFNSASAEDKQNLFREEIYVMAFERFGKLHYKYAYHRMLKKYIMSHVPLFATPYLIENFHSIRKPSYNFIDKIREQL